MRRERVYEYNLLFYINTLSLALTTGSRARDGERSRTREETHDDRTQQQPLGTQP